MCVADQGAYVSTRNKYRKTIHKYCPPVSKIRKAISHHWDAGAGEGGREEGREVVEVRGGETEGGGGLNKPEGR